MQYQHLSKFMFKSLLAFSLIFPVEKIRSMQATAGIAATAISAPSTAPIILPAIALVIAYQLLVDKTNPIGKMYKNLNEELLNGTHSNDTPVNVILKPKTIFFSDKKIKTKLEQFLNDFTEKQSEILHLTYDKQTECINLGSLKITDYTPITKIVFNSNLTIEPHSLSVQEQLLESEKITAQPKKIYDLGAFRKNILQKRLFPISKSNNGSLSISLPTNDSLAQKIHDLESARTNTIDTITTGGINTGLLVYKIGAFLKQTYKSIQARKFQEQQFEESLKQNSIAQACYESAIKEAWLLFLKANSKHIPIYQRIEALLNLNKIYLPGRQGELIQELVRKLNGLYFEKNGHLNIAAFDLTSNREDIHKLLLLFIRGIFGNKEEANAFIEFCEHYQMSDFAIDLKNDIVKGFDPVQKSSLPFSNRTSIDQKIVLRNFFNIFFRHLIKICTLDLSNQKYNPYKAINDSYLKMQDMINKLGQLKGVNIDRMCNNYMTPLKSFLADQSILFDDFNMLKIFDRDPAYIKLQDKERLLLDENYRDKIFEFLRDRYNSVDQIMQNLNLSNVSPQAKTFIYKLLDKQITLDGLLKEIELISVNPTLDTEAIFEDFFDAKGILKAFNERITEFPQLIAMPSCRKQHEVLKLLNRYLIFYPSKQSKHFFNEGLNYLINSIDNDGQINFQNLNLAKAYYKVISNTDHNSILVSSNFLTTGLNDFTCKDCFELNNDYLIELANILRLAAKKLKTESDPYQKDLARFLIYAIQHLKKYNYTTSKNQFVDIIKYLRNAFNESIGIQDFIEGFTHILEEVKTPDSETEQIIVGQALHEKINEQTSSFISQAIKLTNQRIVVNNFYKQLYFAKNPEFYNQIDFVTSLCASVFYKANSVLDAEAFEIAKIAEDLSYKANELVINIIPNDITKNNYHLKSKLDSLIIKCQEYLKPFQCDNTSVNIPTQGPCLPEDSIDRVKECGTGRTEEKTNFPSYCVPFSDFQKYIIPCGTGPKIELGIVVLPCNHSRMQGMISLIPSKNSNKEESPLSAQQDESKSSDTEKEKTTDGAKETLPSTQIMTGEEARPTTPIVKPQNKSGQLTPEIFTEQAKKIKTNLNEEILKACREFSIKIREAKILNDSKGYEQAYDELINKLHKQLKDINDSATQKVQNLGQTVRLHTTPKETESQKKERLIRESLEFFDGSTLPKIIKDVEKIVALVNHFKNIRGALGTDGPIARIVKEDAWKSINRILGSIYELEKAKFFEQQGTEIISFDNEFLISDEQRRLWDVSKNKIEFDIECIDKLIEAKDIRWDFVENFYTIIDTVEELHILKDLDLRKFNTKELTNILKISSSENIVAKSIQKMHNFLQQIKAGSEMSKSLGKKYEFYSKHAIPPAIKEWLKNNKITFFEKECNNCDCDKKYSRCSLQ